MTLTRTSGANGPAAHQITWVGNDGTFTSPKWVNLPLNTPVTVTVDAKPAAGAHSAIMRVDDPKTAGVDFGVLDTVIAAPETAAPRAPVVPSGALQ